MLKIGDILFTPDENKLSLNGQSVTTDKQTAQILLTLCMADGPVSKEQLVDQVWQGRLITDAAISTAIRRLRKVFSELDDDKDYVKTISKVGFKLTVDISEVNNSETFKSDQQEEKVRLNSKKVGILIALLLILAVSVSVLNFNNNVPTPPSYQQAQFLLSQKKHTLIPQAILYLEQAVIEQPDYLLSHTTLAQIYAYKLSRYLGLSDEEIISRAKTHIALAKQIDPNHPDIALSQAMLDYFYLRDLSAVSQFIENQIQCDDKCNFFIAYSLPALGRGDEAVSYAHKAYEMKPDFLRYNWELAWSNYMASNFDQALIEVKKAEKLAGNKNHIFRAMLAQAQKSIALSLFHWGQFYLDGQSLTPIQHQTFSQYLDKGEYPAAANYLLSVIQDLAVDQKAELLILADKKNEALDVLTQPLNLQKQTYLMAAAESPAFTAYFSEEELKQIKQTVWRKSVENL